jgi:surface protein
MENTHLDSQVLNSAQEQCWPSDILLRLSHFLSLDGSAVFTWHKLVYLVCKNAEWIKKAQSMERPLLLTIEFAENEESRKFEIPFYQATVWRIEIDWGDGCIVKVPDRRRGYASHEYKHPGVYLVKVFPFGDSDQSGNGVWLDHLGFQNKEDTTRWWRPLRSFDSLGTLGITSLSLLFCRMKANIVDLSRLRTDKITSMSYMFSLSSFNQPIGHWNVSNVTNMSCMFQSASDFNQPIGAWNVSRVVYMGSMFSRATHFNQPIGDWDVRNVGDMAEMFSVAESFNQPIGDWNVRKPSVQVRMFEGAKSFRQQVPWHTK